MSLRGWKEHKGAAHYRSPDLFFFFFFYLEIACPDDEFNWIFIADFNKASRPRKVILLITACHATTYHHNTVTKCQRWRNFENSFLMDEVGCSLGIMTPKKPGTVAVSIVQGQKSFQQLLQNSPFPSYYQLQTVTRRQDGILALCWIYPVGTCAH